MPGSSHARLAMLHVGRCGSTVVALMLEGHPHLTWDGEVFEPAIRQRLGHEGSEPEEFLRLRVEKAPEAYGFETKYLRSHHLGLLGIELGSYIDLLDRLGFTHFVTLHRRNYLRRVASGAVGRETRRWHTGRGEPHQPHSVHLNLKAVPFGPRQPLLRVFEEMKAGEAELANLLSTRGHLDLIFEDDIRDAPERAYRMICEFAGLDPVPRDVELRPTNPEPLSEMITNYEEIAGILRGTEYEWMLD